MGYYSIDGGYRKKGHRFYASLSMILVSSLLAFFVYSYVKSLPPSIGANKATNAQASPEAGLKHNKLLSPLPWPSYGQAAYGVVEEGVLAESDAKAQAVPVASLAKIITALAVLEKKPLAEGSQGPLITLTLEDERLYQDYIAKNGSVLPVKAGVQISQYQALQAMLMISANNISDTLAVWAFGSVESYTLYANSLLRELGFTETTVADASGFSPATKGTASEMVQLGILYIQNPLLRGIAEQKGAEIPFAGHISNYNSMVNDKGVIGLKIGYTDEAGRTFLVADIKDKDIQEASVVAVFGADHLQTAMRDAKVLLASGDRSLY